MFIDASVVVSVVNREPDFEKLVASLQADAGPYFISPMVRFESMTAIARTTRSGLKRSADDSEFTRAAESFAAFVSEIGAVEISITPEIGVAAVAAIARYGKGCGHPARLNLGDCFSYACAKTLGVPLLYKGDDFAKTDLA
ncbi:MAG: type II toxin-antitoxin system VapC family toxin [Parvularculaceae bacterium]